MADFCNQCAGRLGLPPGDLKGIGDIERLGQGSGWKALCEGCGPTYVDDEGNCISDWCLCHHDPGKYKYRD